LAPLTSEPLTDGAKQRLAQISPLAPGDFTILRNRFALCSPKSVTHEGMLQALQYEVKVKKFHKEDREIGF